MRLAAFDLGAPAEAVALGVALARAGCPRLWATEHHGPSQGAAPLLVATAVAVATAGTSMGVGTAGVMLHHRSPWALAEEAALVEAMFPGRLALGVVTGLGDDGSVARALLDGRADPTPEQFSGRAEAVARLCRDLADADDLTGPGPRSGRSVPLWIAAGSAQVARLAGSLGAGLLVHLSLGLGAVDATTAYREAFVAPPEHPAAQPDVVAVAFVGGAGRPEGAGHGGPRVWRGPSADVAAGLVEAAGRVGASEVAVTDVDVLGADAQVEAHAALADAWPSTT